MAASHLARSFQEEVTCPICLEYFTDPVSIECGHNFCQACLSQCWGESEPNFSCPQCRETITQRHLRPNYQLGNLVELVKCLRLPMGPALEGQPGCEKHQEALKLFCREDQAPICVIYRESWAHQAHKVLPIEEAAQEYKEKLQGALGPLRKQLEEAQALTSKEEEKTTEWQRKVQAKRETIAAEFNNLHTLLREEEQLLLQRLAEEERETLQRLQENVSKLSQQSASLQQLISEIEGKCQQPVTELLKDAKSTLSRSENMKLQGPEAISADLQRGYKICLDMREALNRFAGAAGICEPRGARAGTSPDSVLRVPPPGRPSPALLLPVTQTLKGSRHFMTPHGTSVVCAQPQTERIPGSVGRAPGRAGVSLAIQAGPGASPTHLLTSCWGGVLLQTRFTH
ncbi:E3 ubiquitin-protein ligase TRIM11-like isoform X2 [Pelodiscus sinensis]|uniref:E3 ubiquitin-protein ligase TRIM11-like isoform X2 n=1 Tax=Pelodiscus sinensis TaxID=13735 RepID=UPI003F6C7F99